MVWAYGEFGDDIYTNLDKHEKAITDWAEKQELNLNARQSKTLVSAATWQKQLDIMNMAAELMAGIGSEEYNDFNLFRDKVDENYRQFDSSWPPQRETPQRTGRGAD